MVVGQLQAELAVDLGLVGGVGVAEDREEPAEAVDKIFDLLSGEAGPWWFGLASAVEGGDGGGTFGLHLGDPAGDDDRVGAGFEGGPVAGEFAVAVGNGLP